MVLVVWIFERLKRVTGQQLQQLPLLSAAFSTCTETWALRMVLVAFVGVDVGAVSALAVAALVAVFDAVRFAVGASAED
jgi:uncharacterized PurR-regulated membrane protein YhhQ (DUF165 family)